VLNPGIWAHQIERDFLVQVHALRTAVQERLIPTFDNIEAEADAVAQEVWDAWGQSAGPDADSASAAEAAMDAGINHYQILHDTKQALLNLFSVGLHHLVEQQQLTFLRRELVPWGEDLAASQMKASEFQGRLRSEGIDTSKYPCWAKMKELSLVANVVKHAEGNSAQKLRQVRPDLFTAPSIRSDEALSWIAGRHLYSPLSGDDLYVTEADLTGYFDAAQAFWEALASDLQELERARG
jgi:hypothetical protein